MAFRDADSILRGEYKTISHDDNIRNNYRVSQHHVYKPYVIIEEEEDESDLELPYDNLFQRVGCDGKMLAAFLAASRLRSYEESYVELLHIAGLDGKVVENFLQVAQLLEEGILSSSSEDDDFSTSCKKGYVVLKGNNNEEANNCNTA